MTGGRAVAVKSLDLADGRLKVAAAPKGLKEGERLSICGQFAVHSGSGKWRPLEKENHQATECCFPAMNPDGISAGEQAAAALNLRASHERAPSTKLGSAPKAAADGDTALSAASIQKRLAAKLHV